MTSVYEIADLIVNMNIENARDLAHEYEFIIRTTMVDGERYLMTADLDTNRINVWVENDLITKIVSIG